MGCGGTGSSRTKPAGGGVASTPIDAAAIDIATNEVKMIIGEVKEGLPIVDPKAIGIKLDAVIELQEASKPELITQIANDIADIKEASKSELVEEKLDIINTKLTELQEASKPELITQIADGIADIKETSEAISAKFDNMIISTNNIIPAVELWIAMSGDIYGKTMVLVENAKQTGTYANLTFVEVVKMKHSLDGFIGTASKLADACDAIVCEIGDDEIDELKDVIRKASPVNTPVLEELRDALPEDVLEDVQGILDKIVESPESVLDVITKLNELIAIKRESSNDIAKIKDGVANIQEDLNKSSIMVKNKLPDEYATKICTVCEE